MDINWGIDFHLVLQSLSIPISILIFGEECGEILKTIFSGNYNYDDIKNNCNLDEISFEKNIKILINSGIVNSSSFDICFDPIFDFMWGPHIYLYSQEKYIIPQDKSLIKKIVQKVIQQPTLSRQKVADSLATDFPEINRKRIYILIEHLLKNKVLIQNDLFYVLFDHQTFLAHFRLSCLESLFENNDRRVLDVIKAIFSYDFLFDSLITRNEIPIETDLFISQISNLTGLQIKEIQGILTILSSPEYSLIRSDLTLLTPLSALNNYQIKQIGRLLSEIGLPLSRRVINYLLKYQKSETIKLCDNLILSKEQGLTILEKLKTLFVLNSMLIEDAPFTKLKRKFLIWSISFETAIDKAKGYVGSFLCKLYYDYLNEEKELKNLENKFQETSNINERKKNIEEKLEVLQNTIISVSQQFFELVML